MACQLDLHAVPDRAPAIGTSELGTERLQLRLRGADDVAPAGLAQPRQIGGTGHAAVGNPDTSDHAVPGLHGVHDRLQSLRIVSVAGERSMRMALRRTGTVTSRLP